jgi:AcrR family transcriptional regulator
MRAVAERVQVKAGSLYYHFASKDLIIDEILDTGIEMLLAEVQQALDRLPAKASFAEQIEAAVEAHISGMASRELLFMQVYEHLPPVLKRRSRSMRRRYANLWTGLLEDGVRRGEVDPRVDLSLFIPYFLGGLSRVPEWIHATKAKSGEVARLATITLLKGIATKP